MKRKVLTLFLALSILLTGIMPGWEEIAQAEEGPIEVQVSRISGSNRYTTSAEIAERMTPKADKVIVASGENYPDALVSAPLSMKGNFPILLTAKNSLDPRVKSQLQALAPEEVVIAGGEGAVSSQVEKEIRSLTSGKITRIGGENRYQTATLFKEYWEKTFGQDAKVTLVDGNNYPDALSAAGLIYEEGSLLLAGPGQTPDHVDLVIGGDKAVPGYPGIRRIAGEDRFATAVEIAKAAGKSSVILVDGKNFPDALSAAALARKEGASILLVSGFHLPKPVQSYLEENKPTKVTIVGGENAVSKEIEKEIVPCIRGELSSDKPASDQPGPANLVKTKVSRVVDGDTIVAQVGGRQEKIRLIGIDTPETVHPTKPVQAFGAEASAFTEKNLNGKEVYLELGVQQRDKYGRILAYVWLTNQINLKKIGLEEVRTLQFNGILADQGYAHAMTYPPNDKYADYYKILAGQAEEKEKGLWAKNAGSLNPDDLNLSENLVGDSKGKGGKSTNPAPNTLFGYTGDPLKAAFLGNSNTLKFHRQSCQWAKKIAPRNRVGLPSRDEAIKNGFVPCKVCKP